MIEEKLLEALEAQSQDPQTDEDKDALVKHIPALIAEIRLLRKFRAQPLDIYLDWGKKGDS